MVSCLEVYGNIVALHVEFGARADRVSFWTSVLVPSFCVMVGHEFQTSKVVMFREENKTLVWTPPLHGCFWGPFQSSQFLTRITFSIPVWHVNERFHHHPSQYRMWFPSGKKVSPTQTRVWQFDAFVLFPELVLWRKPEKCSRFRCLPFPFVEHG